jgi:hypothetical protein
MKQTATPLLPRIKQPALLLRVVQYGILCGVLTLASAGVSRADEDGVSFWLPGLFGSLAAAPQQPGWSFVAVNYYDSISASGTIAAAREFTIGNLNPTVNANLNVNIHANLDFVLLTPSYVFATPVFGGQLAVSMTGIVALTAPI